MTLYESIMLMDWDEVLMLAMGFAGFAYIVADLKRERRLDQCAMDHEGRLARLEANSDDSVALEARLVHLEAASSRDERLEERISGLAERLAVLEERVSNLTTEETSE